MLLGACSEYQFEEERPRAWAWFISCEYRHSTRRVAPFFNLKLTVSYSDLNSTFMATVRTKRPLAPRTNISNDKDVAELANQFASGLRIAEAAKPRSGPASKAKVPRAALKPSEDPKSTAMKNVNTVLQSLSSAIQSDWKATTARTGSSFTSAGLSKLATTARTSLSALRKLTPGALDVERAALSTVGKLVTLEMASGTLKQNVLLLTFCF